MTASSDAAGFDAAWAQLEPIGRSAATGGYRRFAWTAPEFELREWFTAAAGDRGLDVETDRNGNLWAWWGAPGPGAVVTGSHLDSVPDGGAFDGPLGVLSSFAAVDALRADGVEPAHPLAVVAFAEEEGARFGLPTLGSRLATGAASPETMLGRRDADGVTLAEAMSAAGLDPQHVGRDDDTIDRIALFVELHVEQGRALDVPVGIGSGIGPHGRWRFTFTGRADHAGTTRIADRSDPMLPFAATVLAARDAAERHLALATVGRVESTPNATNVIPSAVNAWLDARAAGVEPVAQVARAVRQAAELAGERFGVGVDVEQESETPPVDFDPALISRLKDALRDEFGDVPAIPAGAGHDAGVLADRVPSAMLFVRNPTGVSHAPAEFAERDDCRAGVRALTAVLRAALVL